MRKASLLPTFILGVVAPLAYAGPGDGSNANVSPLPPADTPAESAPASPPKSAFGRIMGLMTQLLQEASTRPPGSASDVITSFENAGITVRVTPVDGADARAASAAGTATGAPRSGDDTLENDIPLAIRIPGDGAD